MYQVLARKWRPQSFDALVGQDQVARTLRNALQSGRIAHAYLFSGVRGTGKTSVARILAKCLNCEDGPTATPCNRCAPCVEITDGRAIDVLEIDAASRTKVEQTRELLETLSYAAVRDRYKVLIIDEVHMLSKSSFNALLKTLEEPPPRVVFVLATTEFHKILPTILSRCQVFEFRRVGFADLARHLREICDHEQVRISDAALERVARAGDGSVRDALSVLERVVAFAGHEISDEQVLTALGAVRVEVLVRVLRAIADRDAAGLLGVLDEVVEDGRDLVQLWSEMLSAVRDAQLARLLPGRFDLLTRSSEDAAALVGASEKLSQEDLGRVFRVLADLEFGLKNGAHPRFLFEAALLRLASLGAVRPIEEFLAALGDGPPGGALPSQGSGGAGPPGSDPAKRPPARSAAPAASGGTVRQRFESAVQRLKPMLGTIVGHAAEIRVDAGALVIEIAAEHAADRRQLERADYRRVLGEVAAEVVGPGTAVRVVVAAESGSPAASGNGESAPAPPDGAADQRRLLAEVRADPGVSRLLREFGAQVLDIRPLMPEGIPERVPEDTPAEENA